jgi:DNA-binding NtrC family response regulator
MIKILIIDESPTRWHHLKEILIPPYDSVDWHKGSDITLFLKEKEYNVIILSIGKDKADGFDVMRRVKGLNPQTPVVVISEVVEPTLIVSAVKEGAFDFVTEPFSRQKMQLSIERALADRGNRNEIDYLRREQDIIYDFGRIIACSPAMKRTIEELKKFSMTDSTMLITGETGTGKSFLSGAVHFNSSRRNKPFIKINCANIPETLLESELFGHERGAFTGANKTRVGRLEQGRGGTVFLDEICEMSPALQAKLLRVLEEKSFERVGSNKTIYSDVRIIAATNRDPEKQVEEGKFREDLYYRINVLRLHLPALR